MLTIQNLKTLTLADGLPSTRNGTEVRYKTVVLREIDYGDDIAAAQLAERVVMVGGQPKLLISDALYRAALTMRHIEKFAASGLPDLTLDVLGLDTIGKLSQHDQALIEERVYFVALAAKVRYGLITEAEVEAILAGKAGTSSPQPLGEVAGQASADRAAEQGPAMLASFSAEGAAGAA